MYVNAEGASQNPYLAFRRGFCGVIRNLYMNTCHLCVNSATRLLNPQQNNAAAQSVPNGASPDGMMELAIQLRGHICRPD